MRTLAALAACLCLSLAPSAAGAGPGQCPHASASDSMGRLFDPDTVESVKGTVTAVTATPHGGKARGVHLTVKTKTETIPVHLGPDWYVEQAEPAFAKGDVIEVRGSRVTYDGKPAIIASVVRRGDDVLMLRDKDGSPRWAGPHRHRG